MNTMSKRVLVFCRIFYVGVHFQCWCTFSHLFVLQSPEAFLPIRERQIFSFVSELRANLCLFKSLKLIEAHKPANRLEKTLLIYTLVSLKLIRKSDIYMQFVQKQSGLGLINDFHKAYLRLS
jgi:hypothetical protein